MPQECTEKITKDMEEKVMKVRSETHMLKDEVALEMHVEIFDGEELDTECSVDGSWCIEGSRRHEFAAALEKLVNEYCI